MNSRRYLFWFSGVFLALAGLVAAINFVVDPYLVFGNPRVQSFNKVKVDINDYVRVAKAFEPFRFEAVILLAGNSRIEMGLDPDHACFGQLGLRAYNLGIPGAGVGQQLNYVLNVVYATRVQRVFLSVDFSDFLVAEGTAPPAEALVVTSGNLPLRFDGSDNPEYTWTAVRTRFNALLSLNSLIGSIQTVLLQGPDRPDRLPNGFNPARDFASSTAVEGPGSLFEQKMTSLRERFASPKTINYADGTPARDFDLLSKSLDILADVDVEVVVLTNPFHEEYWNLLHERGLLELYEAWQDEVEKRVRNAPGRVTMWDFSADSDYIHEPVPTPGEKVPPLDWFWEPSHYRKELGDKMLDSMLAIECGTDISFGRQLSVEN